MVRTMSVARSGVATVWKATLPGAAAVMGALVLFSAGEPNARAAEQGFPSIMQKAFPDVGAVVQRAQSWIGPSGRIKNVTALEFISRDETSRVLFPDRYQIASETTNGRTVVSFDGQVFRRRVAAGGSPGAVPADATREAGLRTVAIYALRYLVRTLPGYPVTPRVGVPGDCAGVPGVCVVFESDGAAPIVVVIDPSDGRIRATVSRLPETSIDRRSILSVVQLSDDHVVSGLRMPFTATEDWVFADGAVKHIGTRRYETIHVNPPLKAEDFVLSEQ